jgi:DNA invertase Pin-like site-specific DNA recombinase
MLIGYARVSTDDQNLGLQRTALGEAAATDHVRGGDVVVVHRLDRLARGCARIYEEKVSGASRNRPELTRSAARRETVSRWVEGENIPATSTPLRDHRHGEAAPVFFL